MRSPASYGKRLVIYFTTLLVIFYVSIVVYKQLHGIYFINQQLQDSCNLFLKRIEPSFTAIVIDVDFLHAIESNSCYLFEKRLKVAVTVDLSNVISISDYNYLDIVYYEITTGRDYIKFFGNVTRAIPQISLRSVGNWRIPEHTNLFSEYWRRSTMLDCLGLNMNRTEIGSYLPITESLNSMSKLSKLLISFNIFPFLIGGTLLGWYRECGIIAHTKDLDLSVLVEEYNPEILDAFEQKESEFFLYRKLGRSNDSFELTLRPRGNDRVYIDIFFMYNNGINESWVGGTGGNGQKYLYIYPLYDPYCAADLMGHLFWVSCQPDKMLECEYGPHYKEDHKSSNFSWNKSHYNLKLGNRWSKEDMKDVYKVYSLNSK